jgi:hypothetical protein
MFEDKQVHSKMYGFIFHELFLVHKIQTVQSEAQKVKPKFKKWNQQMKRVFKPLQSATLIFGPAHQLTSGWTDVYKFFSTFRV